MLKDKVVIITGASRGIGAEIAKYLANKGAKVIVNYRSSDEKAKAVVNEIKDNGGDAFEVKADIASIKEIDNLFNRTIEKYGKVDIVVNNAGLINYDPISKVTEEIFDDLFNVNVKGTYFMCQKAFEVMSEGGSIINFSTSVVGQMFANYSVYAGTKGAVEQFTRQLSKEFGMKNIRINAIAPGPVNTELFNEGKTKEQIAKLASLNAFNRIGETTDITSIVGFLVSDESKWISGQTIRANGAFI